MKLGFVTHCFAHQIWPTLSLIPLSQTSKCSHPQNRRSISKYLHPQKLAKHGREYKSRIRQEKERALSVQYLTGSGYEEERGREQSGEEGSGWPSAARHSGSFRVSSATSACVPQDGHAPGNGGWVGSRGAVPKPWGTKHPGSRRAWWNSLAAKQPGRRGRRSREQRQRQRRWLGPPACGETTRCFRGARFLGSLVDCVL